MNQFPYGVTFGLAIVLGLALWSITYILLLDSIEEKQNDTKNTDDY